MISFPALVAVTGATVIVAGAVVWILRPWRPGMQDVGAHAETDEPAPAAGAAEGMEGSGLVPVTAP